MKQTNVLITFWWLTGAVCRSLSRVGRPYPTRRGVFSQHTYRQAAQLDVRVFLNAVLSGSLLYNMHLGEGRSYSDLFLFFVVFFCLSGNKLSLPNRHERLLSLQNRAMEGGLSGRRGLSGFSGGSRQNCFIWGILLQRRRKKKIWLWRENAWALRFNPSAVTYSVNITRGAWGQSSSLGRRVMWGDFPHFSIWDNEDAFGATFYLSSGSINQLPLEIRRSSFQQRFPRIRPPGLLTLKPGTLKV